MTSESAVSRPAVVEIAYQRIALAIDVGCDVVRDLPGGVAEAGTLIEARAADPHRPIVVGAQLGAPEADVVALSRVRAHFLFECEVLRATEQEEVAHRGLEIGMVEDDAAGDREAAPQRDRVGGLPAGGGKGALDRGLATDQRYVQRIARQPVGPLRHLGHARHRRQMLVVAPEARQEEVGEHEVAADRDRYAASEASHGAARQLPPGTRPRSITEQVGDECVTYPKRPSGLTAIARGPWFTAIFLTTAALRVSITETLAIAKLVT